MTMRIIPNGPDYPDDDPDWAKFAPAETNGVHPPAGADPDLELDPSLQPVDLESILDGTHQQPVPDLLTRDDGRALLYAGAVNGIHGDSGVGKSWIVCHLIRENARRARRTLLLDFEDTAASITARLMSLGMTPQDILTWLIYVRPQVPLGPGAITHLCQLITSQNAAATIIDSVGEAFALEGIDENKDVEVGPWYRRVARPLAETGTCVDLIDHATKAADNPLHPSGSKRKRAAITGASYLVEATVPFALNQGGRLRLTCAKDRHGQYRRGEHVADLVMTGTDLALYAPTVRGEATVPVLLAARAAVEAAKTEGSTLTGNALEGLMTLKTRATIKRGGIDLAVARGSLTETLGPRGARQFTYNHDLDD